MKKRTFERGLPGGYRLEKQLDAKSFGFGLLLSLGSLILFAIALIPVVAPLYFVDEIAVADSLWDQIDLIMLIYLGGTLVYTILHELTHGAAYKIMTGEKLTFGISWNCAFCGVPRIFTYRRTALIAVYAPFVLFSVIFIPLLVWFYFSNMVLYIALGLIFATHVSGCIGDLYMGHLLLHRYTDRHTLVNDTGPCVSIFTFNPNSIERDYDTIKFVENMDKKK